MPRPKIPKLGERDRKQLTKDHPRLGEFDETTRSRVNVYLMFQFVDATMSDRKMNLFVEQKEDNRLAPLLRMCRDAEGKRFWGVVPEEFLGWWDVYTTPKAQAG